MKVMVVRTDKLGRFKMGDIGEVLENDFEKYDYRVDLGPLPKSDLIGGIDAGNDVFFQPGDDAQAFRERIGENDEGLQDVAPEYFNNN